MTFNMFYVGSKYPYFISYRGKWVYLFYPGCIFIELWQHFLAIKIHLFRSTGIFFFFWLKIDFVFAVRQGITSKVHNNEKGFRQLQL